MDEAGDWISWEHAWRDALYGDRGFYLRQSPVGHFRTSVQASDDFAHAVLTLARESGARTVTDIGAGQGELLARLRRWDDTIALAGVDVRGRPDGLDRSISWLQELPEYLEGLVIANELLDNLPCAVVEVAEDGSRRLVEVERNTGRERLGPPVPVSVAGWLDRWWPVDRPGERAEVGLSREEYWADVCSRTTSGMCVAIDYGHTATSRPPRGTLAAYRQGRQVAPIPDGSCDITAHVAVDALAARVGAEVVPQREMLIRLGVSGARPPMALATADPRGYVQALSAASRAAEITDPAGFGSFSWLLRRLG